MAKYDLAEKYCKSAIALDPNRPEAHSNLGIIYDSQGRLYEAIKAYKDSLELNVQQPKLLMNLGGTYMRQGRLGEALQAFRTATQKDPDSTEAWEQMATCQYHRKDYAEAVRAYEKAISLDQTNAAAHRGLGVVYMTQFLMAPAQTDLRDKALAAWHASLELQPDQEDVARLVQKYAPKPAGPEL
jgi:Flp pilus assembly protein TadD